MDFLAQYWLRLVLIALNLWFWGYVVYFSYTEMWLKGVPRARKTSLHGRYPYSRLNAKIREER